MCVVDFKREVGLWHGILASVFNGMRVVFVPYSLMKINLTVWMLVGTKLQATVGLVKSRDLHWGLLATRDHKDVNLSALKSPMVGPSLNPFKCVPFRSKSLASVILRPVYGTFCRVWSPTGSNVSLRG